MLTVARYRFAATLRRRWGGYLAIALLIGLVGGIAMGSIAAARRTQSSYPAFLTSTNASDLTMSTYGVTNNSAANGYSAALTRKIARLPEVTRVEGWVGVGVVPLKRNGAPNLSSSLNTAGSVDGLYFNEDRATPVVGRMADPRRVDEFVTTALGARLSGWHVGQVVPMGVYTANQFGLPGFGTPSVPPARRIDMKLVGLVVFNNQVIQDDADRLPTDVVFTPALTRTLLASGSSSVQGTWYAMQLAPGTAIPAVEEKLLHQLPSGSDANFSLSAITETKVERAVKPESIALGVFGAIAALAALAIGVLAVARVLRSDEEDLNVLRALGASPATTVADGLVGVLGAIVCGALLAVALALSLSPLSPLGPIRAVYHESGFAVDWTVLGFGLLVMIGGLGATAVALAYRGAPHRLATRSRNDHPRDSRLLQLATSSGLSASAVVGLRFAVQSGRGRTSVPARSVLVGATLAVILVTTTLTFSSGLHTLVSRPALYGWNWSYALVSENDVPPQALAALHRDPDVAAASGYQPLSVQIDGQTVPALLGANHATVAPPILSGHAVDGNNQVVMGPTTLALLHKHVGDTVIGSFGTPNTAPLYLPPFKVVIVGTATLPAIGGTSDFADHPSMGTGVLVSEDVSPAISGASQNPDPTLNGPGLVFVRLRNGVSAAAGRADMGRITTLADKVFAADRNATGDTVEVLGVQHPAEIVNYQSTGATPVLLAAGLALGAIVALALTLIASVRRRRRDLALLKTLGFTARQLAATVAWQASVIAVVAAAIGVPVGIAVGRQLWTLFAQNINAVPQPTVPASVILVAAGVLILANLVAAIPARLAARTPAALVLRAE
ncbi:MAG TPA: FtsX-like permease family protein [Acidimicrobiales bacterium]